MKRSSSVTWIAAFLVIAFTSVIDAQTPGGPGGAAGPRLRTVHPTRPGGAGAAGSGHRAPQFR